LESGVTAEHPQKVACRFEVRGDVADYCKTAAKHLSLAGWLVFVFPIDPPHQKERALKAIEEAGLALMRMRPVCLKEGQAPLLGLFACTLQAAVPLEVGKEPYIEPPLTIRTKDGKVHPEYRCSKMSIGFPP
jgi:tRNA1(Val) A37 N6-methylase TrmN6